MPNFNFERHPDLDPKSILSRQSAISRSVTLAGVHGAILHREPRLKLNNNFCQNYAAGYRMMVEQTCLALLESRWSEKTQLVAIHIVPPPNLDASATSALERRSIAKVFRQVQKRISRQKAIKVMAGCYELDHVVGGDGSRWQGSIHAVGLVKAPTFPAARDTVAETLGMPSSPEVYRPLVCKQIDDLPGAVRYAFKSLQFGSVTSRLTWTSDGRRWARKVALKPPERNELVWSMADVELSDRVLMLPDRLKQS